MEDICLQAEKLLDYVRRGGDEQLWLASKDFSPRKEIEIIREYTRLKHGLD